MQIEDWRIVGWVVIFLALVLWVILRVDKTPTNRRDKPRGERRPEEGLTFEDNGMSVVVARNGVKYLLSDRWDITTARRP